MDIGGLMYIEMTHLKQAGFNSANLQYRGVENRLEKALSIALEKAVQRASYIPGKQEFELQMTGLLGEKMDVVDFKFHYVLNPADATLYPQRVTGRLADTRLDFLLPDGDPLPTCGSIYLALLKSLDEHPVQENKEEQQWKRRL